MYLHDTNILSELIRPRPSPLLQARIEVVPADEQFTAIIAVGELVYGAHKVPARRDTILQQIEGIALARLTVLPFDEAAARRYGDLRAELERRGTPLHEPDLQIAATALVNGLTLVTANVRHFERVPGLRIENWLSG